MRISAIFRSGCVLLAVAVLGGCGGSEGDSNKAHIRLLNVSPGYNSLDLYVNDGDSDTDTQVASGVGLEALTDYITLDADTYTIKFKRAGVTSTLLSASGQQLTDDSHATYIAYGSNGKFAVQKVSEDVKDADDKKSTVTIINTAEAGSVDVYVTDTDVDLSDTTPQFGAIASGSTSSAATLDSGTYRMRVTGTGDNTDIRLDVPSVTFDSKKNVTVIITSTQGGMLVNAILLPQQGSPTVNHTTKARVRAFNGNANGTAVTASIGGFNVLNNAGVGVITNQYGQIEAGTVPVNLSVDGTAVTVANQTLTAGGDYTLLVWSDTTGTRTTLVSDDNHEPTASTKLKFRVMNGMSALGAPISVAVNFSTPTGADGIAVGAASAFTEIGAADSSQIDITNSFTTQPVKTLTGVSLSSNSVYTLFMSGSATAPNSNVRKER